MTTLLVILLPAAVIVGLVLLHQDKALRSAPFPPPAAHVVPCPFCGHQMRHGRLMHRGNPVWWEPSPPGPLPSKPGPYPAPGARAVLEKSRWMRFTVRGGDVCDACHAVVISPDVAGST